MMMTKRFFFFIQEHKIFEVQQLVRDCTDVQAYIEVVLTIIAIFTTALICLASYMNNIRSYLCFAKIYKMHRIN